MNMFEEKSVDNNLMFVSTKNMQITLGYTHTGKYERFSFTSMKNNNYQC